MSYELMFNKALELQKNGALSEAERLYRQILETAPDNANVLNMLGLIAQERGLHTEAVSFFYKAINSAPRHFPIYFNLAVSLGVLDKFLESEEAYKKVLEINPNIKEAYMGLGNLYWQQNRQQDAVRAYEFALKINPTYIEAEINLAELKNDTEKLEKLAENNSQAAYYLGRRAFDEKDYSRSEKYLTQADDKTESPDVKNLLGQVLFILGEKDAALTKFHQSACLDSSNTDVWRFIADLEADKGNYENAEKYYRKAINLDDKNLSAHVNYADFLQNRKRIAEALEEYRKAVLVAPETPEISYNLALILKNLGEYEQAFDLMFNALSLAPFHIDWSLNMAETLVMLYAKEPEKTRIKAENWLNKMPENIVAQHLCAIICEGKDDIASEYNKILFDNFATTYEATLNNIEYHVIDEIIKTAGSFDGVILDLGCGTGLLGERIKNDKNRIVGVDISSKMLEIAGRKNVYDALITEDINVYLRKSVDKPDLIVAADVFCYFGDLNEILQLCYPTKLVFSIENDDCENDFSIQINGRYKHNVEYVVKVLKNAGYSNITNKKTILRKEDGKDVSGNIITAF